MHLPRPRGLANWPDDHGFPKRSGATGMGYWNATQEGLRSNRVLQTLTNKMSEGRILLEKFALFEAEFPRPTRSSRWAVVSSGCPA